LDLLTNRVIFEDAEPFNKNINYIDELTDLNKDFYKDLLLYKPPHEEITKQETPTQKGPQEEL
jgi:hypothetical protein